MPRQTVTAAEAARQVTGGKRLGPGVWEDAAGGLHFSVPELLTAMGLPDTAENREAMMAVMREWLLANGYPDPIVQELES